MLANLKMKGDFLNQCFCAFCILSCFSIQTKVLNLLSRIYCEAKKNITYITKPVLPSVFNVFVDAASDGHGHNSIIPGGDEHESKTQAHSQEGQSPAGEDTHFTTVAH